MQWHKLFYAEESHLFYAGRLIPQKNIFCEFISAYNAIRGFFRVCVLSANLGTKCCCCYVFIDFE